MTLQNPYNYDENFEVLESRLCPIQIENKL